MKNFSKYILHTALGFALLGPQAGFADSTADSNERFSLVRIHKNHQILRTGLGGNVGIVSGNDHIILIDDGYAESSERLKSVIQVITGAQADLIINTHWHPDHVGGNELLGTDAGLIVSHEKARARLTTIQRILGYPPVDPLSAAALPNLTFPISLTLHMNGDVIELYHLNDAHTDGDIAIRFVHANILYAGDIFTANEFPYIDVDTGGTLCGTLDATRRLYDSSNQETIIVPGHGSPRSSKSELGKFRIMLSKLADLVDAQLKTGVAIDDVAAERMVASLSSGWIESHVSGVDLVRILERDYQQHGGFDCL